MDIHNNIDETFAQLEKVMEKANNRVDYGHRALFKRLINLDNQILKSSHVRKEEAKGNFLSELVHLGFQIWAPKKAEDYKTRYDSFIHAPARKLEAELDAANRIIDSIMWKELIAFYEDNKQFGLTKAILRWMQQIKPNRRPTFKVIRNNEKSPDENNG